MTSTGGVGRVRGKRLFDVGVAALLAALTAPIMAVVALAVRATSPGRVIYRGRRVGLGGDEFDILKFRTMTDAPTAKLTASLHDDRITPVGHVLRRYKLDELPQFFNVLRGDMSIVGPRPEFRQWVDLYDERERAILSVRPGLTDYASLEFIDLAALVGGGPDADERYLSIAFPRKNQLRLKYVETMSWRTDLTLIFRTVAAIVGRGRG